MRVALLIGVLAALAAGALAFRSASGTPERPVSAAPVRVPEGAPMELRKEAPSVVSEGRLTVQAAPSGVGARPEGNALADAAEGFRGALERALLLEDAQRERIDQILREREGLIEAYHRELRASGILNSREYERRTWGIRTESYRRIAAVLRMAQAERFHELVTKGQVTDPVAFELDENMVILD